MNFLDPTLYILVIVNTSLNTSQVDSLLRVLREDHKAIGYALDDLKGIHPSVCMHRIIMEDDHRPLIEHQRRLNPNLQEVVKKEILKLLKADIVYPIFNNTWVSSVYVVPKKGRMIVVKMENNELIPTRTITAWCMCIDYQKLNIATIKITFPSLH